MTFYDQRPGRTSSRDRPTTAYAQAFKPPKPQTRPTTAPNRLHYAELRDNGKYPILILVNMISIDYFQNTTKKRDPVSNIGIPNQIQKYHTGKNIQWEHIKHFMDFKTPLKPFYGEIPYSF